MKKLIWIAIPVLLIIWAVGAYNKMVNLEEEAIESWGNVETQYERRAALIPNLVSTVKGYADHEREVLEAVVNARSKATGVNVDASNLTPEQIAAFQEAQNELSGALSRLLVVVENYPDLKANQNFLDLQSQLEGTENRISTARIRYNESVKSYNATIRRFPGKLFAGLFGFERMGYFEAAEGSDVAPKVEF